MSERSTREVSEEERRYEDGRDAAVLDIITIRFARPEPEQYQTENHVIDPDDCWASCGSLSWYELQRAVEDPQGPLWINGDSSSYGQNDRVGEAQASALTRSLYLIRPENLRLLVAAEGGGQRSPRRRVRAHFQYAGFEYCLVVTDPQIESEYLARPSVEYSISVAVLCVSLGELFHGHAYKLAAAVITPGRRSTTA